MPLVALFVGRQVVVETEAGNVKGKLIHYVKEKKREHIPSMLILYNPNGQYIILRSWQVIKKKA
ncbi:MAG: hypothetical protein U9O89_01380 [Thermoproteota archaeon]|nr:hypothetical protein [Thermoproteota archaeon]